MLEWFLERIPVRNLQGEASHPALCLWPPTEAVPPVCARPEDYCPAAVPRAPQVASTPPAPRRLELRASRTDQSYLRSVLLLDSWRRVPLARSRNPGSPQAPLAHSVRLAVRDPQPPFLLYLALLHIYPRPRHAPPFVPHTSFQCPETSASPSPAPTAAPRATPPGPNISHLPCLGSRLLMEMVQSTCEPIWPPAPWPSVPSLPGYLLWTLPSPNLPVISFLYNC